MSRSRRGAGGGGGRWSRSALGRNGGEPSRSITHVVPRALLLEARLGGGVVAHVRAGRAGDGGAGGGIAAFAVARPRRRHLVSLLLDEALRHGPKHLGHEGAQVPAQFHPASSHLGHLGWAVRAGGSGQRPPAARGEAGGGHRVRPEVAMRRLHEVNHLDARSIVACRNWHPAIVTLGTSIRRRRGATSLHTPRIGRLPRQLRGSPAPHTPPREARA